MLKFRRYDTAPALGEYIHGYWDIQAGEEMEVLDLVPDGHPELAILIRPGIQLAVGDEINPFPMVGLLGQLSQRSITLLNPGDRVIYVKLYPWTPFLLFRTPSSELLNSVTDLNALTSDCSFRQLVRDVTSSENMLEICGMLDRFFLRKIGDFQNDNPFITFAVRQIFQTHGTISIEDLTSNIHASRRYVEKVFKKHIGMSPKQYARLIRVKKASLMLLDEKYNRNISRVAAQLEYYDQSHFLKDFKAVVCRTPTEFLRQEGNLPMDGLEEYLGQWDYS